MSICVQVSKTGELVGAIGGLFVGLGGLAGSIRVLSKWRLPVDPGFPERGPAARLFAGLLSAGVSVGVLAVVAWGLLHPC